MSPRAVISAAVVFGLTLSPGAAGARTARDPPRGPGSRIS